MAHSIPNHGTEFEAIRFTEEIKKASYTYESLDGSFQYDIPVEKDSIVVSVGLEITTAFSGSTCTVGDGSDADGFLTAADCAATTKDNVCFSAAKARALAGGKKYTSDGIVRVTHVTGLTAGAANVYIKYFKPVESWRASK